MPYPMILSSQTRQSVGISLKNNVVVFDEAHNIVEAVNQIHSYATGGSFDNCLPFSLSMGCGSWGENSISDNVNYKHYLNTTRVVRTIPMDEPTEEEIFGEYRLKDARIMLFNSIYKRV